MTQKQFMNGVKKIMEHNEYTDAMLTVEECTKFNKWTPTDLIIREYLNNGCSASKGFLGITPQRCENLFGYVCEHKNELIKLGMINKDGYNNFGFTLWKNYDFVR